MPEHSRSGQTRQRDIYIDGVGGRLPPVPVDPARLESRAKRAMRAEAFAYVAGGAGSESTIDANRRALDRWGIVPRVLRDVEHRDISVELFGHRYPTPFLLCPIGVLDLVHREGDLAVARAAATEGVPMIYSNQAAVPMERCAAATGDAPRWFQLYWSRSDALVESLVARAEACGCSAIVLTLDTTMLGWRPRDLDRGYLPFLQGRGIAQYTSDPVFLASLDTPLEGAAPPSPPLGLGSIATLFAQARNFPGSTLRALRSGRSRAAVQRFVATYSRPSLQWHDLEFLRARTNLPILLKGVLHPDDARRAASAGADGVIVSNHGGRQIDGAVGALSVLPDIVRAVGGQVPVLFDSGIRTGSDAFKALALGASAVCLGRPYVYGLAIAGEAGVRAVVRNIVAEFDLTMGLAGCREVAEIGPNAVQPA